MNDGKTTNSIWKIVAFIIVGAILGFYLFLFNRIMISDGILVAINTAMLGATGSAVVALGSAWIKKKRHHLLIIAIVVFALTCLIAYRLNRDIRERKELVETKNLLQVIGKAMLDDYFEILSRRPVFLKEMERQKKLEKIQKFMEDAEQAGGLTDEPAWYVGMIAFHRNEQQQAIDGLSKFIKDREDSATNGKLAKAYYARGLIRYGLASDRLERCDNLIRAYKDARSAVRITAAQEYKHLLYKVAKDIISEADCKRAAIETGRENLDEIREFASCALGPTSLPEPEYFKIVHPKKWKLIGHEKDKSIAIYSLDLGWIPIMADLKSVLVEIHSPKWQIISAIPKMSSESIMETSQEPQVSKKKKLCSILFPNFDPEQWSIVVKVRKWDSAPDVPEFSTRVHYLRYP